MLAKYEYKNNKKHRSDYYDKTKCEIDNFFGSDNFFYFWQLRDLGLINY